MESTQIRKLPEQIEKIINSLKDFDEDFIFEHYKEWQTQRIESIKNTSIYLERKGLINSFFNISESFIEDLISLNKSVSNYQNTGVRKDLNPINQNYYECLKCINAIYQFKGIIEFNVIKKQYEIAFDLKTTLLILLNEFSEIIYAFIKDKSIFETQLKDLTNHIESANVPQISVNITNKDYSTHEEETKNSTLSNDEIIEHPFIDENNFKLFKYFVNNWKQSNTEYSRYTYFFNFFIDREKPKPKETFSQKDFFSFVRKFKKNKIGLRKQVNANHLTYSDYLKQLESEFIELEKE